METMDKLWAKVEAVTETQIRHDERLKANEAATQSAMRSIAKLEGELNEKFDVLTVEIREGFKQVHLRIAEYDTRKHEQQGYQSGVDETRKQMLKQFGLWVSIVSIGLSFIIWWLTR